MLNFQDRRAVASNDLIEITFPSHQARYPLFDSFGPESSSDLICQTLYPNFDCKRADMWAYADFLHTTLEIFRANPSLSESDRHELLPKFENCIFITKMKTIAGGASLASLRSARSAPCCWKGRCTSKSLNAGHLYK